MILEKVDHVCYVLYINNIKSVINVIMFSGDTVFIFAWEVLLIANAAAYGKMF